MVKYNDKEIWSDKPTKWVRLIGTNVAGRRVSRNNTSPADWEEIDPIEPQEGQEDE